MKASRGRCDRQERPDMGKAGWKGSGKNLVTSYSLLKQWAAVRKNFSAINVAPQRWIHSLSSPKNPTLAIHGQNPTGLSSGWFWAPETKLVSAISFFPQTTSAGEKICQIVASVADAMKGLQACIYKSANTGLFLNALAAASIVKFNVLMLVLLLT